MKLVSRHSFYRMKSETPASCFRSHIDLYLLCLFHLISRGDQVIVEAPLTGRRLEHCDLSFFQTSVESTHELELYVIWGVRMVEILWLRPHGAQSTSSYLLHQINFSTLIMRALTPSGSAPHVSTTVSSFTGYKVVDYLGLLKT